MPYSAKTHTFSPPTPPSVRSKRINSFNSTNPNLSNNVKLIKSIVALSLIFVSVILFISLLLYNNDACITKNGILENNYSTTGIYGNCAANFLFSLFGKAAYLLSIILFFLGIRLIYKNDTKQENGFIVFFGVVVLLIVIPSQFDLFLSNASERSNIGNAVLAFMLPKFAPMGTHLLLFFVLIASLSLIFSVPWNEIITKTGLVLCYLIQFLSKQTYGIAVFLKNATLLTKTSMASVRQKIKTEKTKPSSPPNFKSGLLSQLKDEKTTEINKNKPVRVKPTPIAPIEIDVKNELKTYSKPNENLLKEAEVNQNQYSQQQLLELGKLIERKLMDFKIGVRVVEMHPGPVITRFELDLDNGVKVSQINNLSKDLARSLSLSSIRIVEVIPGKPHVGIEIPNQTREMVSLKEIISSGIFKNARSSLTIALGKDISGNSRIVDLASMPHLLVAGTTGSGKSVAINSMILSMLYKSTPEEVKLILIDPKMIELSVYQGIPHLITPVVTKMENAFSALQWCIYEMNRRYKLMTEHKFTHISDFNDAIGQKGKKGESFLDEDGDEIKKMPFIVIFIDEFADLILVEGKKIENLVARLAGKARAAGIHLIIATQRPSVNVITGIIKANIPSRIAFQLPTKIDSRTILEQGGAEQLLGKGDMLYLAGGAGTTERIHGAFVSREEVIEVVEYWKAQAEASYQKDILNFNENRVNKNSAKNKNHTGPLQKKDDEDIYKKAVELVIKDRRASISYVQRKLQIGYNRSANLIEKMESEGVVSSPAQNGNRSVLK